MQDSNEHQIRIINGGPGLISLALGNAYVLNKTDVRLAISKSPEGRETSKTPFYDRNTQKYFICTCLVPPEEICEEKPSKC